MNSEYQLLQKIQQQNLQLNEINKKILMEQMRKDLLQDLMPSSLSSSSKTSSRISSVRSQSMDVSFEMERIRHYMQKFQTHDPQPLSDTQKFEGKIYELPSQTYKVNRQRESTKQLMMEKEIKKTLKSKVQRIEERQLKEPDQLKFQRQKERMEIRSKIFNQMKESEKIKEKTVDWSKYEVNLPEKVYRKDNSMYKKYLHQISKGIRKCDGIRSRIYSQKIKLIN